MFLSKQISTGIAALVLALAAQTAIADVVVVVSARSAVTALSKKQVADIFLGKTSRFPDGNVTVPLDQAEGVPARDEFYMKMAGKSPAQIKAHWSKIIFTGKGQPPKEVGNSEAVKKAVAGNPGAISYIDHNAVDASVKAVMVAD